MNNSFFYICTMLVSAVVFFPFSAAAQKNKKVDAGSVLTAKTPAGEPAARQSISAMEQAVLDEINTARKEPKKYIEYLENYKKLFKGKIFAAPGEQEIVTNEGTAAVDEAINYLKTVPPWLVAYKFSNGLNKSAALQLKDLMIDSSISHRGRDGSDLPARMKKFGTFGSIYAENISYYGETARDIVMMWIIDDGLKSRSHRRNIFSPTFKVVGIAFGKGKKSEGLCVINFADSFTESGSKPGVREF